MQTMLEQTLLAKIRILSPQQLAEVEDFVEFLAAKAGKRAALERLLAIAPALETAGAEPLTEAEIVTEVQAARVARRARLAQAHSGDHADHP
jgi:plasmid stabilization system protein ParE